ncbi:MAG: DUF4347 domain-containing protein, partial [Cyanobacteria bacterium J06582_2]
MQTSNVIVFVDSNVDDFQYLVNNTVGDAQVFVIDSNQDGVIAIAETLKHYAVVEAVHIVSHGSPGSLQLGNSLLNSDNFNYYADYLANWSKCCSFYLYGCEVAAGEVGNSFIKQLQQLTQADIAASSNLTGSSAKGGDWNLEIVLGSSNFSPVFLPEIKEVYDYVFNDSQGIGNFYKRIIDTNADEAHSVNAADFDGDNDIDLVATDFTDGIVAWYENDGDERFTKIVIDPNLEGAYPSSVGDVNGDGAIDVLAAGYDADTVVWYENDGSGNFSRRDVDTNSDGAHSVITDDINQDGQADLLVSNQDENSIVWYENDGSQNFTKRIIDSFADGAKRAISADIDGDGDIDIIGASYFDDTIALYENDGSENFTKRIIDSSADGAYSVFTTDINSDGNVDILASMRLDNTVVWYQNDGNGGFTKQIIDSNAKGTRDLTAVDLNNDGNIDVLATSLLSNKVSWYQNDGSGNFSEVIIDSSSSAPYGIFTSDVNADGLIDVLIASRDDNTISINFQGIAPPPVLSEFISDDFNNASLGSQWAVVNPKGDGTQNITGVGTGDALLELSVPAGKHDLWRTNKDAIRTMQSSADEDFEAEVKFESEPTQSSQLQGILVDQDANNWIRFDTYHDGSQLRVFAGVTTDGSSQVKINVPVASGAASHLRVNRQGDVWTLEYSADGTNWSTAGSFTHSLNVSEIGTFAGNAGPAPAFTAEVDYFFNTASPIVPEDGGLPSGGNEAPIANNDNGTVAPSDLVVIDVLSNDSDSDGQLDPATVAIVNQ